MSNEPETELMDVPSLRSRSLPVALGLGLLIGAMITALVLGGSQAQVSNGTDALGSNPTDGGAIAPTGPSSGATGPTSPPVGGQPGQAGRVPGATQAGGGTGGGGGVRGEGGGRGPGNALGIDCSMVQTPGIRGVTPTTIKIGIGLADLEALKPVLGPAADFGPQEKIFDAILKGFREEGRLPVCGRELVPVYQKYQVLTESQSRAVCQSFVNDDKVFAVLTTFSFRDPLCLTRENKTFLIDQGYQIYGSDFAQSGGRLFTLHPPVDLWYRIWTNWVIARMAKQPGAKLGVYYNTSNPKRLEVVENEILKVLRANGIQPVIATSDSGAETLVTGDPNDAGAVLKFKNEKVTHVMMSVENFMKEAQRQNYHPQYFFAGTDAEDAGSGRFDPDNGNGAQGLIWDRVNNISRGEKPTADQERCIGYATKAGIARPREEYGQWLLTMMACDSLGILVRGIQAAGSNLTTTRLVLGVRTINQWTGHYVVGGGYTDSKNWLIDQNRESQYYKACGCWKSKGPWQPLFLKPGVYR